MYKIAATSTFLNIGILYIMFYWYLYFIRSKSICSWELSIINSSYLLLIVVRIRLIDWHYLSLIVRIAGYSSPDRFSWLHFLPLKLHSWLSQHHQVEELCLSILPNFVVLFGCFWFLLLACFWIRLATVV